MRRLWIYLIGLLITTFPAFIFTVYSLRIINIYLNSGGHFWIGIFHSRIEVLGRYGGIYLPLDMFVLSAILFVVFIFFLIMFLREFRKTRRKREEERIRKEKESYQNHTPFN